MNKQNTIAIGIVMLMIFGIGIAVKIKTSRADTQTTEILEPSPDESYGDHTIVGEHVSECSYCKSKQNIPSQRFGSFHRILNQLTGKHAHFHRCSTCGEKYVCRFECNLSEDNIHHHEQGLLSRSKEGKE